MVSSNTIASDIGEIDAYVLGGLVSIKEFTRICIAVSRRTIDNEEKRVITAENVRFSDERNKSFD